jgi:hypothetical protein
MMRKFFLISFVFVLICFVFFLAFNQKIERLVASYFIQVKLANDVKVIHSKDFDMKDTLQNLSVIKDIFEIEGLYNLEKLTFYKNQKENLTAKTNIAYQYFLSGNPELAINELDKIYAKPNLVFITYLKFKYAFKKRLKAKLYTSYTFEENWGNKAFQVGLCNLRLSEINNCLIKSNKSSCILPFNDRALHKNGKYAEAAAHQFQLALKNRPKDPVNRWLLNIAHVAIGDYPENIPAKQRIDFEKFSAEETYTRKFTNMAEQLGVNINTFYGGSAMEDFNNDGYLDLFTTSADLNNNVVLHFNNGENEFNDITNSSGLLGITGGVNVIHADYNNDGFEDIYIIRGGWMNREGMKHPNSLLQNSGDGTFTDVTEKAGLLSFWATHSAAWGDINNDGFLDLFVGNERANAQIFINNGDETFKEVAKQVGIHVNEYIKGSVWLDFNNDGLLDLYISTYVGNNRLYKNLGMSDLNSNMPIFKEVSKSAGIQEPFYSFPAVAFDFNNDGWLDILCADFTMSISAFAKNYINDRREQNHPRLYINNGDETFTDKWLDFGDMRQTLSMGINVGDINNDGFEDIYFGTGYPDYAALVPNLMYLNLNGIGLADITSQSGLGHLQKGHGIAFGDYDRDGDQDIYLNIGGWYSDDKSANAFFKNNNQDNYNNWLVLKLIGSSANTSAIGARVKITVSESGKNKRDIYKVVSTGGSYGSNSLQLEVGLGKANQIDVLEVIWPNKEQSKQTFYNVRINQYTRILEGVNNVFEFSK